MLLRGLVRDALTGLPEVQLVDPPEPAEPAEAPCDVIVLSLPESGDEDRCVRLLERFPRARVLALGGDAVEAVLYELRPHRTDLGEMSPERLRAAVREGC